MEIVRLDLKRALLFLQKPVVCVVHPVCVRVQFELFQENDNMNRCVLVTMIVVSVCCLQKCEHYADNEIELR